MAGLLVSLLDFEVRQTGSRRFDPGIFQCRISHFPQQLLCFCTLLVASTLAFHLRHSSSGWSAVFSFLTYGLLSRAVSAAFVQLPSRFRSELTAPKADIAGTSAWRPADRGRVRTVRWWDRWALSNCADSLPHLCVATLLSIHVPNWGGTAEVSEHVYVGGVRQHRHLVLRLHRPQISRDATVKTH